MTVGLVRSAIPALVAMAGTSPNDVFEVLVRVGKHEHTQPHRVTNITEVQLAPLPGQPHLGLAYAYIDDENLGVILAAGRDLVREQIQSLAKRLARINWRDHLVRLQLEDLDPFEMRATLTAAAGAVDVIDTNASRQGRGVLGAAGGVLVDIEEHAHRWQTTGARMNFRGLLDAAEVRPQIVKRPGGEEVFVLGRAVLTSLTTPKSAADIVSSFAADTARPAALKLAPRPAPRGPLRVNVLAHQNANKEA